MAEERSFWWEDVGATRWLTAIGLVLGAVTVAVGLGYSLLTIVSLL